MPDGKGGMHKTPDTWQIHEGVCPKCGQRIRRKGYDKFLKCHRCHNYLAGLPILRWATHPTWIGYYAGHPLIAIRDSIRLLVLVFLITWLLPSASVPEVGMGLAPVEDSNSGASGSSTVLGGENTTSSSTQNKQSFNRTKVERYVWEITNGKRVENGLDRVQYAPRIVNPTRSHARNMAEHDYVGHTQPNGQTMEERYSRVCRFPGENAIGGWYRKDYEDRKTGNSYYSDSERELAKHLVARWMNSTGHRENILRPRWNELGVGVYKHDDGKVFAAQTFC